MRGCAFKAPALARRESRAFWPLARGIGTGIWFGPISRDLTALARPHSADAFHVRIVRT